MAESEGVESTESEELLTLSEVSKRTRISMPTLQRYKKLYQSRIPSVGKGRRQRYPENALPVFEEIKKENIGKRGRPPKARAEKAAGGARRGGRKAAATTGRRAGGKKTQAAAADSRQGLLTLTQISEETGISYPTLVRYVKLHGDRIPHQGRGRKRRYHPEAVGVFRQLRQESPRGRQKKAPGAAPRAARAASGDRDLAHRVQALERSQERLEKEIHALIKHLQKPLKLTLHRT